MNARQTKAGQTYVDDCMVRGRSITLRNIVMWYDDGHYCDCEDKVCAGWSPEYSCLGPLLRLIQANQDINDYTFDAENRTWSMTKQ